VRHGSPATYISPVLTRAVPFLIAAPLAWAVVLGFHPAPDPRHIHASLAGQSTRWLVVHGLTVLFIGLVGIDRGRWAAPEHRKAAIAHTGSRR